MNETSKLMLKKRVGDIPLVAEMIGESVDYTIKLLQRTGAKKHQKAVDALAKIIATREDLISNSQ
jgi:hypothetical protein